VLRSEQEATPERTIADNLGLYFVCQQNTSNRASVATDASNNPVSQLESTRLVTNWPVTYGVGLLLSIRKNTLIGKWPALLGNRPAR
jgi:hypothetical protein